MGSDLRLTGLASGMDWQPIVEKLLELEAAPKKRLEAQKKENEAKVSDLGLLKSQLDTLKSASAALQNEDLFESGVLKEFRRRGHFRICLNRSIDRRIYSFGRIGCIENSNYFL